MSKNTSPSSNRKKIYFYLVIGTLIVVTCFFGVLILPYLEDWRVKIRVNNYSDIIQKYAKENNLPAELIKEIIKVESKGIPDAVSKRGAVGLMQVRPITMKEVMARSDIPEGDLMEPDYNIKVGTAYLRILSDQFKGEIWFVLAAYHAGPSRVRKWKKKMPGRPAQEVIEHCAYPQTAKYVRKVLKR